MKRSIHEKAEEDNGKADTALIVIGRAADTWFGAATKFYTMDEKAVFSWNTEQTLTIPKNLSGFTIDTVEWDD